MVIPSEVGILVKVQMILLGWLEELETRGRINSIQTPLYKDQLEYLEESWKPGETCCPSKFFEKPPVKIVVKNAQVVNNNVVTEIKLSII